MENNESQQSRELEDFLDLSVLQQHIAKPCSRELLVDYLQNLQTLIHTTKHEWIREIAHTTYWNGKQFYDYLVKNNIEPSSSVID